jgi:two-component system, OmpR family, sensor histidine kinase KdpD
MSRGHLRIYLGAAPGVGKTFAMLDEGWRRHDRGTDVVVGFVETHGRPKTAAQLRDLEIVPRRVMTYRGATFEELDLEAVLARRPEVALIDEMAHTNVSGSRHAKRFEDIEVILEAGIDVITTVNIQHLESVNDVVERITGVKQRETVPDAVVRAADQVELVDMTPEALRRRMAHGNIYAVDKVDAALGNYFRIGNLSALRELALLWVADKVDAGLQDYMEAQGIEGPWETRERVVVAVTGSPSGEDLIRRAARMAQRAKADLLGVHVQASDGLTSGASELLDTHRRLLVDLGGEYHEVIGGEVAPALTQFARAENATQLVLGATRRSRWAELTRGSIINAVLRESTGIDVHVISQDRSADDAAPAGWPSLMPRGRRPRLSTRRQLAGWLVAVIGIPLLTMVLTTLRGQLNLTTDMLLFLVLVMVVALIGGIWPAMVGAVVASLSVNWYFTQPVHTFTIAEGQNLVALVTFLVAAGIVSTLVTMLTRRSADSAHARAEAEALARVAGGLAGDDDAVDEMVTHLRTTFDLDAVSLLAPDPAGGWRVEASAGGAAPSSPAGHRHVDLVGGAALVYEGPALTVDDERVLRVFAIQLSSAVERRRLRAEAAEAAALAEADQLRTAILRAVSHDLRTPLASIKASATSLLQDDVEWTPEARQVFLATIDEESDRLNILVGNLLDMSRLESGVLEVSARPVALEEVVAQALASLSHVGAPIEIQVSEQLPRVVADAGLLERVVANVVSNALRYSPEGKPLRIEAGQVGDQVHLRIIDQGPGVRPDDRERIFEPFQRLGDRAASTGVGLGLAVARGFTDAMGGELSLEDTPGGGLTTVIALRGAPSAVEPGEAVAGPLPVGASRPVAPAPVAGQPDPQTVHTRAGQV